MSRYFSLVRSRYLIGLCGVVLALICGVIVLGGEVLVRSFDRIEVSFAANAATRASRALSADLSELSAHTHNHGNWYAVSKALQDHDPGFLERHFQEDLLKHLRIDVVWIVAADGRDVFSTGLIGNAGKFTTVPIGVRDALRPYRNRVQQLSRLAAEERIVITPNGLLAFAAEKVTRSDQANPTEAVLFLGRFIDLEELRRISEISLRRVDIFLKNAQGRFDGIDDPETLAWLKTVSSESLTFVRPVSDAETLTYLALMDVEHRPAALLGVHRDRTIYSLGHNTTWLLVGVLLVLVCTAGTIVMLLFHRLQNSIRAQEAAQFRYTNLVTHLRETIVLADPHSGRIVEANPAFARASGYEIAEIKARTLGDFYPHLRRPHALRDGSALTSIQECRVRTKHGAEIDMEVTVTGVKEGDRELLCVLGRDITVRKHAEQQAIDNRRKLSHLANHDSLTGLPNRLFLQTRLPRLLRKLAGNQRLLAVFYVDVDHFKNVNDLRGHGSGDRLLRIFAKRLKAATGAHDIVVRMGGDEFVVVASLLPDVAAVESIASRLVATAQAPLILDDATVNVSASIGVSVYPNDGQDLESLLKHADIALYQAKENGRNGYKLFNANMNAAVGEEVAVEQGLRHAIGTEQLFLEYQPIINLATGELESFEALLRWRHPEMGYVPPIRFIPVAERTGLIIDLGTQVLRLVCAQLREWQDAGVPVAPVAVNISPLQLQRAPISTLIHELTLEFDIDPKWLHFEITESAMVKQSQDIFVTLQTLRELGSKVSIDDFGTGFSSLSYLKHMPVDTIKIDKAFVQDVVGDANDAAIVGGVVSMAKQLRLRTVAEGIETEEQLLRLRELGCMYGQGYYFSRPVERSRCRALLEHLGASRQFTDTLKIRALGHG